MLDKSFKVSRNQYYKIAERLSKIQKLFLDDEAGGDLGELSCCMNPVLIEKALDNILRGNFDARLSILKSVTDSKIVIRALDGNRVICNQAMLFKGDIDPEFGINFTDNCVATPETLIRVSELVEDGTFKDMFLSLPGTWDDKFMTQHQIVEFCEVRRDFLRRGGYSTFFLCKKNESKAINEEDLFDDLVVVDVTIDIGLLNITYHQFDDRNWDAKNRYRVISPLMS